MSESENKVEAKPATDPQAPAPRPAPLAAPSNRWRWLSTMAKPALGYLVLGIIPLFIIFANTQIQETFNRLFSGCVLVLNKEVTPQEQFLVTAHLSGKPPGMIPLRFEARAGTLDFIIFDELAADSPQSENLARHPMQGLVCPGQLCPEENETALHSRKIITLDNLHPEFSYRFLVWFKNHSQAKLRTDMLNVVAVFPKDMGPSICRVESQKWFNFWVWAGPFQKSLVFLLILVSGGLVLRWVQQKE